MRSSIVFILWLSVVAAACGRPSDQRTYTLQGQVLSIEIPRRQLTIKHEEIKNLMPAMTMPYDVKDEKAAERPRPGRSYQRDAGDRVERSLSHHDQEGRPGASGETSGRNNAGAPSLLRFRAVEA